MYLSLALKREEEERDRPGNKPISGCWLIGFAIPVAIPVGRFTGMATGFGLA